MLTKIFSETEEANFELPDGTIVDLGKERFTMPEVFFRDNVKFLLKIFEIF